MARSRGADPATMSPVDGDDLAAYLGAADARAKPLRPAPRLVPVDQGLALPDEED